MDTFSQLLSSQPEGFSLQQDFYRDAGIYRRELERLFHEIVAVRRARQPGT